MRKIAIFLLVLLGVCLITSVLKAQKNISAAAVFFTNVNDSTTVTTSPIKGTIYYNKQSDKFRFYQGTTFHDFLLTGGGITNTAANNELMKSNGTNSIPSGLFVTTVSGQHFLTGLDFVNGPTLFGLSLGYTGPVRRLESAENSTSTNTVQFPFRLITINTAGTIANGIGTGQEFVTETSNNNFEIGNTIESVTTDVTAGSEDFDLVFRNMTNGATATEKFRVGNTAITATVPFTLSANSTATTQSPGDATTKVATDAFVAAAVAASGGTGNAFFAVAGPATSTKTFTFPNANATVLTTNAAVTGAQGGTGQTTTTTGDILVGAAANTWNKLAKGSANQILGVNDANTTAEYKTVSNGLTAGSGTLQLGGAITSDIALDGAHDINIGQVTPVTNFNVGVDPAGVFLAQTDAGNTVIRMATDEIGLQTQTGGFISISAGSGGISLVPAPSAGVTIGVGTAFNNVYSVTATLNFPSTAAGAISDLTISLSGVGTNDSVFLGPPLAGPTVGGYLAWISASGTITVRYFNNGLISAVDPASATFRVTIFDY